MQPSALLVGAKKCGTGAIKNFLKHHPDVYFLEREAHFFGKPLHYDNGTLVPFHCVVCENTFHVFL